jgi:hypothetical protein
MRKRRLEMWAQILAVVVRPKILKIKRTKLQQTKNNEKWLRDFSND